MTLRASTSNQQATGLGWIAATVLLAVPWLLPDHGAPWTTFRADSMMALAFGVLAVVAVARCPGGWRADPLAIGLVAASVVPLLQARFGLFIWPSEATLIALFVFGAAAVLLVAARLEAWAPCRLADALWASFVAASLASTGLALYQWAGLDSLGFLVIAPTSPGRPAANIGQPNLLASLIVWGLIGVWWGLLQRRIGLLVSGLAAAFLLLGLALTQSRTGWAALALLVVFAVGFRRHLGSARLAPGLVALGLWFCICVFALPVLSDVGAMEPARSLADQGSAGKRPQIWQLALQASLQAPWFGYGWNQGVQAHTAVAEGFPHLHVIVQHAHNLVLDLVLWNGWPLGLLFSLGLAVWWWRMLRRELQSLDVLLMLVITSFLMHAMIELPHCLFLFVGPVAAMAGILIARHPPARSWILPRAIVSPILLVTVAALGVVIRDYDAIEADLVAYRIRAAHIGSMAVPPPPQPWLLDALGSALQNLRIRPHRGMDPAELGRLRRAVERYPSDGGLFAWARTAALNGRPDEASTALSRLCLFYPPALCQRAGLAWRAIAQESEPELADVKTPAAFAGASPARISSVPSAN